MSIQSLPNLNELSHAQKDELIRMLWLLQQQVQDLMAQTVVMQERIKQLEGQLAKTGKNSSKPPSSDGYAKASPKSLRLARQKPTGGQKQHPCNTLYHSANVDETVIHYSASHCSACRLELHEHTSAETRQVFELPRLTDTLSWLAAHAKRGAQAPTAPSVVYRSVELAAGAR